MELAPVYDLSAVNQRHFRKFQFLVQRDTNNGQTIDPAMLKYPSPLGWEHINLTGDYQWKGKKPAQGRFRPLRTPNHP
jgi:Tn3 transposase DDE domain